MSDASDNLSSPSNLYSSTTTNTTSSSITTDPKTRLIAPETRTYHFYMFGTILYTSVPYLSVIFSNTCFPLSPVDVSLRSIIGLSQNHQKSICAAPNPCITLLGPASECCKGDCTPGDTLALDIYSPSCPASW